jgi:acetyl esterase
VEESNPTPADLAPESKAIFDRMRAIGLFDLPSDTVAEMRAVTRAEDALVAAPREVATVEEILIPRPSGSEQLRIRLYRPPVPATRAILWLHGGGWVVGDLESADAGCRSLCLDTDALVASVEYRLAPEDPFPAGLEDGYDALRWLDRELAAGDDPLPLVVAGDSAGGNLAAALCLLARERGGPSIEHQLLIYPVTDHDFGTESYRQFAEGYLLSRDDMRRYWDYYLPGDESIDPFASVLRADDLHDLPPATIVIAGCDVLRDEAEAYAVRLRVAGVPVVALRYAGQLHGFWTYSAVSDISRAVNHDIRGSLEATGPGAKARLRRR